MPDKNLVLDSDPFADEGVAGDFAAATDPGALLDFHEGTDFRVVANLTPIKIGESEDFDTLPDFYIGGDALVEGHLVAHAATSVRIGAAGMM
jgi:hypothetical protein